MNRYDKISDDLVLMIAKDKLKRFVEARRKEEEKKAEAAKASNADRKTMRGGRGAPDEKAHPNRFLAPDFFRGQLGLKDLAYPPIDDDYQTPLHAARRLREP